MNVFAEIRIKSCPVAGSIVPSFALREGWCVSGTVDHGWLGEAGGYFTALLQPAASQS